MKIKIFALFPMLFFFLNATAQDLASVDLKVLSYPKSFASPEKLAAQVSVDFVSDADKVRAAFTWIAHNITYDLKAYKAGSVVAFAYSSPEDKIRKEIQYRQKAAEKTLRTKKGVCQDYSSLFHVVCEAMGVKCIDIIGTSKAHPAQIGKLPQTNDHEWNAVKIGDRWQLVDVTWASGAVDTQSGKFVPKFNDGYFFTPPAVFFLNHFPQDERLLMLPRSKQDFADLPLYYGAYIKSGMLFVTPVKGVISGTSIPFRVEHFEGGKLSYVVSGEGVMHDIDPEKDDTATVFDIALNARSKGYLTLYWNGESLVTYKIAR